MGLRNLFSFRGIISILIDVLDLLTAPIPGVNSVYDIAGGAASFLMWGGYGVTYAPEFFMPGLMDVFYPAATLGALFSPDPFRLPSIPTAHQYVYD